MAWRADVAADEIGGRYRENCHVAKVVAEDVALTVMSEGVRFHAQRTPTHPAPGSAESEEMVESLLEA